MLQRLLLLGLQILGKDGLDIKQGFLENLKTLLSLTKLEILHARSPTDRQT